MLVLTWNLKHGRSVPSAGRELFEEFAAALASWQWDIALLQEVPPWWPSKFAARLGAEQRTVLTSRNSMLALRRRVAVRWPDVIKSNGGGANAILVRGEPRIVEHRVRRLSLLPERRWVHGVGLADGTWIANLHLQGTVEQAQAAARAALSWAGPAPLVLGGDFNVRSLQLDGLVSAGSSDVDHVVVRGLEVAGPARVLERGALSDHAPLLCLVSRPGR